MAFGENGQPLETEMDGEIREFVRREVVTTPGRQPDNESEMVANCMSSEHFGQLAWQFKRMSGSSGLKVQAAIAC